MNFVHTLFIAYLLKIIYDFSMWIYGYFLRIKWVSFYNKRKKSAISYTYQIRKYFSNAITSSQVNDIFPKCNQETVLNIFIETHGYYKHRFIQNFNPFYWIELIFHLPQHLLHYLGFRPRRKSINILNFLWSICGFIYAVYNEEINDFIKQIINSLFKTFNK